MYKKLYPYFNESINIQFQATFLEIMRVIPLAEQHFISVATYIGTQLGVQMVDLVISYQQRQAAAFRPKTKTVKFVTLASLKLVEINLSVKMFPVVRPQS